MKFIKPKTTNFILSLVCLTSFIACTNLKNSHTDVSTFYKEFQNPTNAARPRVWWHWIATEETAFMGETAKLPSRCFDYN